MTEKVVWEVVEDAAAKNRPGPDPEAAATRAKPTLQRLLGPWWRWKLGGLLAIGAVALVLLIALVGVVALSFAVVALLSVVMARLMHWLRRSSAGAIVRRP